MRWPRRVPLFVLVACWLPAPAIAQTPAGQIQLNQYQPSSSSDRILRLDGTGVLPLGQFHVGLDLDYALRPLVLMGAPAPAAAQAGMEVEHELVAHAVGGALLASFGLGHRLEAELALPLTILQWGADVPGAVAPALAGVGNARIGLKALVLDAKGVGVGVSLVGNIPAGVGTLTHERGLGGEARLFASYARGPLAAGVRAGFRLRAHQTFYDLALGDELTAAAGAMWRVGRRTHLLAELAGATAAANPLADAKQSPLELMLGARQRLGKTWLTLAGGPGLVSGYGSPLFRVVVAATWANRPPDSDGDGIPDDDDRCPAVPEDRDGFQDLDGCPDPDNDGDGVLDPADRCPDAPEDRDGFEDVDGCPDPDNDRDGIPDLTDKCPTLPETSNDFEDEDGCPDELPPASDKDKDGITDDVDECPEEPEDKDGFEDADGCPDLDNDKDGIPDASDKCPLQPETINGIDDEDGCPDKGQAQARLGKNEIETLQPIYFDTDRSRVRHAFYNVLGQIASLLKAHPEIGRCAVEGHTDDTGPPDWNQKLSALRATAVIDFLGEKGVDPRRLVPIAHGEHLPWASNETEEGRAKNRRVVFHIEGVNPEEEKKQEQRQERRRRIRHRRESEEKQREQKEQPQQRPEPRPEARPLPRPQEGPRGARVGQGQPDRLPEAPSQTPTPAAAPTTRLGEQPESQPGTAPTREKGAPAPAKSKPPSPTVGPAPFYGPEPPPSSNARKPAGGASRVGGRPAPTREAVAPSEAAATTESARDAEKGATANEPAGGRKPSPSAPRGAKTPAAPRKASPEQGPRQPPTLRELLKLPPR